MLVSELPTRRSSLQASSGPDAVRDLRLGQCFRETVDGGPRRSLELRVFNRIPGDNVDMGSEVEALQQNRQLLRLKVIKKLSYAISRSAASDGGKATSFLV